MALVNLRVICNSLVRNLTMFSTFDRHALTSWKFVAHIYNTAKILKMKSTFMHSAVAQSGSLCMQRQPAGVNTSVSLVLSIF